MDDNSLLFINSGVATLKKYFDGSEVPPKNRITNAQKSIRTNDIENVGLTSRHHTLFEMLGNFSIGDYFKEDAIIMMLEILFDSKWFDNDIEKCYFTIHPQDNEALSILLDNGIKLEKIVKLEANFWEIGEGPGGPNCEIFFDRGESYDSRNPYMLIEEDLENDRVIEIWNIVFSQYNCQPGIVPINEYKELPQKNIDTGMGLERMACILQGVETNYETDNFMVIIKNIEKITGKKYENNKMSFRVIADHIRALTFAIADGVIPSNEGRGYVIRRILRRAMKYGYQNLELKEPFLYKLVDIVVDVSNEYYTYLNDEKDFVKRVIKIEEEKFLKTLSLGIDLLKDEIDKLEGNMLEGQVAFKLYDTFGFPIELTTELVSEYEKQVDFEGFKASLEEQRIRGRNAIKEIGDMGQQNMFLLKLNTISTFVGYENTEINTVINLITDLNQEIEELSSGVTYVILNENPFYAESGGQVSDFGTINDNEVINLKKLPNGQTIIGLKVINPIKKGQTVVAKVDTNRRNAITKNHSATHLLHLALQKVLGKNAKQAGSLQDDEKTRFDFSNLEPVTKEQIKEIQNIVNEEIKKESNIIIEETDIDSAMKKGAMSLFGEKYGEIVRVVTMGDSVELCGGTDRKSVV